MNITPPLSLAEESYGTKCLLALPWSCIQQGAHSNSRRENSSLWWEKIRGRKKIDLSYIWYLLWSVANQANVVVVIHINLLAATLHGDSLMQIRLIRLFVGAPETRQNPLWVVWCWFRFNILKVSEGTERLEFLDFYSCIKNTQWHYQTWFIFLLWNKFNMKFN